MNINGLQDLLVGFTNLTLGNVAMMIVGGVLIWLAIKKEYEPLLLLPIGLGCILANLPATGMLDAGGLLKVLYDAGIENELFPSLVFIGIGAMTDFSSLISNPKLMLLGAAAQIGIFATFIGASALGFSAQESGAIGIIGGADGPTAIFLSSKLAPHLMGAIAIAAYSYMALVPVIQPPIMRLIVPKKERTIRMKPPRAVSKTEKIIFPIIGLLLTTFISPSAMPLLGMLFFGNLLKESGVT